MKSIIGENFRVLAEGFDNTRQIWFGVSAVTRYITDVLQVRSRVVWLSARRGGLVWEYLKGIAVGLGFAHEFGGGGLS